MKEDMIDALSSYKDDASIKLDKKYINSSPQDIPILEWLRQFLTKRKELYMEYNNEIEKYDLYLMLEPTILLDVEKNKQNMQFVNSIIESVIKYEDAIVEMDKKGENELSLRTDAEGKSFYKGYIKTKELGKQRNRELFINQKHIMEAILNIQQFILDSDGSIGMEDDVLIFQDNISPA